MKYKKIIKETEFAIKLMKRLGLVEDVFELRQIDHHPDYDYSEYLGPNTQTYFFRDYQPFPKQLHSVYATEILESKILHYDDLKAISKEFSLKCLPDDDNLLDKLSPFVEANPELLDHYGYSDLTQFKPRQLEIVTIDNPERRLVLQGSFEGDSYGISQADWAFYAIIKFRGFRLSPNKEQFFKQLLIESYLLHLKGDNRVSFFLSYSGLEGFINRKLNSEKISDRISGKLSDMFRQEAPGIELNRHEIYSHVVNDFNNSLTDMRNEVAHGRLNQIGAEQSLHMLVCALIIVCSIEFKTDKFENLLVSSVWS